MKNNKNANPFLITLLIGLLFIFYVLPHIFFYIGKTSYNNMKFVQAYKALGLAYHINRYNDDYRYYYAQTLTHLKPILKVQKDMFAISKSKKDDAARQVATRQVEQWRTNVLYNSGNNYIYNAPSEKGIVRWDVKKFPLKVAILNTDGLPSYYREEIVASLERWAEAVDFLQFDIVQNANKADIVIKITPLPANVCNDGSCQYVVGFTVPTIKKGILKKMTLTLYDRDPSGEYFSATELFNTVMHEMGHALGIMGHSYSEGDLMFVSTSANNEMDHLRSRNSFQYLTDSDINTLKLLYKLIPDVCNTPGEELNTSGLIYAPIVVGSSEELKNRKLKEALIYVKQAPDISGGYVDLGIAYSESSDNTNAVKAFEKAISLAKSETEYYLAYYNLAVQYASMNKNSKALKYARKAQNIKATDEVMELISKLTQ